MPTPEQIQKDIQDLPEEAQALLVDFIQILKRRYSETVQKEQPLDQPIYEKFKESGLIGCVSAEENLSETYKQVLFEELNTKYDHR
ncbi:DUF2281 domain-containing protein [Romeria aff. gracilis LEGE 07310]|uniref:DUF2281 domain-containing protein n=1 Tax=Vasconcelosia minhoensis LEGE 07310 TaxID=915328 RepID=A0A8J7AAT6_9CYAN|nr:DUF2281 domain-containing protein [Romeria gracilis]MBE9077321.1 DUF2281 domain-containing protein [Romeria aff. gracilis LEGE 07310]